jgi:hypothetical protein
MGKGMKITLLVVGLLTAIVVIFLCSAMFSSNKGAPVPASTPVVEQTEDCDKGDRAKRDVEDCGIGVLLDPGKKTTAPAVKPTTKPAVTRCTPTRTRRC